MKVVLAQKIVGVAGSELYIYELAKGLRTKGIDASVLIITNRKREDENRAFYAQLDAQGIPYHVVYYKAIAFLSTILQIHRLLKRLQVHVVHSHLIHADLVCALTKRWLGGTYKLVSTKHGYDQAYQGTYGLSVAGTGDKRFRQIETFAEKSIDYSYTVSKGLEQLYVAKGIMPASKVETIYPGFYFADKPTDSTEATTFRKHSRQIVIVGRLIKVKGHRYLVEAMHTLHQQGESFHVMVVGGYGDLESEIKAQIASYGLTEYFSFIGHTPHVHAYMHHSDVVVVPSLGEGFGIVILEAFNHRKPVVAFDVPACNEIIAHEKSGLLVPSQDAAALAKAISSLLGDEALRTRLGDEAHYTLHHYFTTGRMVDDVHAFYKKALS